MSRAILIIVLLAFGATTWFLYHRYGPPGRNGYIDYQGEKIKLSKYYNDFDDYKNDPNNIAAFETSRVQQLVAHAPSASAFRTRMEMLKSVVSDLEFPGYGLGGSSSQSPEKDGSFLELISIEIPRANQDRYLTYQGRNGPDGSYTLVDDFIDAEDLDMVHLREDGDALVYSSRQGHRMVVHPLIKKP